MKITLLIIFSLLLSACGLSNSTICLRGVVYYYSLYKLAPAYKSDGTLYLCDGVTSNE